MKLKDYIENKKIELVKVNGYRSAELKCLENCKISRFITSVIYDFSGENKQINTDIEIEEVDRSQLDDNEIDAIQVVFNVVKPRCRKPIRYNTFVKEI